MTALAAHGLTTQALVAQSLTEVAETGSHTGETVLFWVVAPIIVLSALGLVAARKAVHSAMFIAVVMIGLAVLYIALEAPFLGVVQIVVYTGAIMMLFLFVIMLIGVDASDSRVETIRGQRSAAIVAGLGLGVLLVAVVSRVLFSDPAGMAAATPEGNVPAIADAIFERYVWAFEIVAILLITAAVGAIVLTHREEIFGRPSQRELSEQRFASGSGNAASPLPNPGVYARHNAVDTPGLLPDGTVSEDSVSKVLVSRGTYRTTEDSARDIEQLGIADPAAPPAGAPADGPDNADGVGGPDDDDEVAEDGVDGPNSGDDERGRR
jgi:NADH-quinone oxidoreductase subunit J